MKAAINNLTDRELSWLSFSERILQEARDPSVPLYERIKFLAIYSSSLDEYFRVRVASLRGLLDLKKKSKKKLGFDPSEVLAKIRKTVKQQQEEFASIFRKHVLPELRAHNIFLIPETDLKPAQLQYARSYFKTNVEPLITPIFIGENKQAPYLSNTALYLAVKLFPRIPPESPSVQEEGGDGYKYAIVEIPIQHLSRFIVVPQTGKGTCILFLDDLVRLGLPDIFPNHEVISAFSIKLTRDAELTIVDEFEGNLIEKIRHGLNKRKDGLPSRFLYDSTMPKKMLKLMKEVFSLSKEDLVPGPRHHDFSDLMDFPNPGDPALTDKPLPPLSRHELDRCATMSEAIRTKDFLLHYPYETYDYVLRFLHEAAKDPSVTSIKITLYRVAKNSQIIAALLDAAAAGKLVTAFVELKARLDEESNLRWAEELEKAGVRVLYSFPGLKVHSKLCLVTSQTGEQKVRQAYLSTGNFNEKTATRYADMGLFTADERLTKEVHAIFDLLSGKTKNPHCEHLLVAPFNMREKFMELIGREIKNARKGLPARMILKMNGLEDPELIEKLYKASREGVKVQLIVRGICCLIPGRKNLSENISAISLIDRFLEHGRIYIFHHGGDELCYLASADWMTRNLSRRIEVAFPVYNVELKNEVRRVVDLQLEDNTKARIISADHMNEYRKARSKKRIRAQTATYEFLKKSTQVRKTD